MRARATARLVVGDVLADPRTWTGTAVVAATAAAVGSLAAALVVTAGRVGGTRGLGLYALSGTVLAFTLVAGVAVVGSVAALTVELQQRSHASWQLVGVPPAAVRVIVLAQLLLVGAAGAGVAVVGVRPLVPAVGRWVLAGTSGLDGVRLQGGGSGWVVAGVLLVVVAGAWRSAGVASRAEGLHLLRAPVPVPVRVGPLRWAAAAVLVLVVVSVVASLGGRRSVEELAAAQSALLLLSPLTAGVLVLLSPLVTVPVLAAWTSLVPARASASWHLARAAVAHAAGRSTAVSAPLVLAVALTGGLFAGSGTLRDALSSLGVPATAVSARSVVLVLGGPLLLAAVGAAATVFVAGRTRDREAALLLAAGATPAAVLLAAAWEALIHVVTATVLGLVGVFTTAAAAAWTVSAAVPLRPPATGLPATLVTAGAALVLLLAATVLPTAVALRRDPARVLAAE
ncbi:FtsX-like permease family protein [Kineococcus rhizosphaerae]|uniref:Putative ABC transport system permease protein n=1 Tax=Kineococcus rhizosphaerae TaxID=559628 RepID=A0A2T0R2Q8_9ACTN|nr:FtsX-like permease family protein [Kineococcus rhizosphaerae]PRY14097.1 putative ABC transport system permease protein [Kineococcus rhizosphaerae]